MIHVKQKLDVWQKNNLITEDQKNRIVSFENYEQGKRQKIVLLYLGVLAFFLGIISLLIRYGDLIADELKLSVGVLGCVVCAGLIYRAIKQKKQVAAEIGLFSLLLLIGMDLGLVVKVYQIPLSVESGLLVWAGLTLVPVMLSKKPFLSLLWIPLFLVGLCEAIGWNHLFSIFVHNPVSAVSFSCSGLFLLLLMLQGISHPFGRSLSNWFIALYYMCLFLGVEEIQNIWLSFSLLLCFVGILLVYAYETRCNRLFLTSVILLSFWLIDFVFQESVSSLGVSFLLFLLGAILCGYILKQKNSCLLNKAGK